MAYVGHVFVVFVPTGVLLKALPWNDSESSNMPCSLWTGVVRLCFLGGSPLTSGDYGHDFVRSRSVATAIPLANAKPCMGARRLRDLGPAPPLLVGP